MENQPIENHELRNEESFCVVGLDLGPCLQGQMRRAKFKSAYNSLINGPRSLGC